MTFFIRSRVASVRLCAIFFFFYSTRCFVELCLNINSFERIGNQTTRFLIMDFVESCTSDDDEWVKNDLRRGRRRGGRRVPVVAIQWLLRNNRPFNTVWCRFLRSQTKSSPVEWRVKIKSTLVESLDAFLFL